MSKQGIIMFVITSDKFRCAISPPSLPLPICMPGSATIEGCITWAITEALANDSGIWENMLRRMWWTYKSAAGIYLPLLPLLISQGEKNCSAHKELISFGCFNSSWSIKLCKIKWFRCLQPWHEGNCISLNVSAEGAGVLIETHAYLRCNFTHCTALLA